MTEEERDKLELEFDELYNKILDGFEDWDYSTLDRLLAVHLKLNKDQYGDITFEETVSRCLQASI